MKYLQLLHTLLDKPNCAYKTIMKFCSFLIPYLLIFSCLVLEWSPHYPFTINRLSVTTVQYLTDYILTLVV
jgi:hypothetical protein